MYAIRDKPSLNDHDMIQRESPPPFDGTLLVPLLDRKTKKYYFKYAMTTEYYFKCSNCKLLSDTRSSLLLPTCTFPHATGNSYPYVVDVDADGISYYTAFSDGEPAPEGPEVRDGEPINPNNVAGVTVVAYPWRRLCARTFATAAKYGSVSVPPSCLIGLDVNSTCTCWPGGNIV